MVTARQRLTLEEFLRLPEEKPALEYFDGRVTQKVSPKGRHSTLQYTAAEFVNLRSRPARLAFAFTELRTSWSGTSLVPDVSVYRWDRIPRDGDGDVADDFVEPPDVAIEILSPGQSLRAMDERCRWFVANGVAVALAVHPRRRTVKVFRQDLTEVTLQAGDVVDLEDVIPGLRLALNDLFGALRFV